MKLLHGPVDTRFLDVIPFLSASSAFLVLLLL